MREAFLASLMPDVIHVTSLFEGYVDDAVTSIGKFDRQTPVSVSLYDLIPLLNPDQYLKPNPNYAAYYARKVDWLKRPNVFLLSPDIPGKKHSTVSMFPRPGCQRINRNRSRVSRKAHRPR